MRGYPYRNSRVGARPAETALRLARYFGTDARSWMNLQQGWALERAARDGEAAIAAIRPRAAG